MLHSKKNIGEGAAAPSFSPVGDDLARPAAGTKTAHKTCTAKSFSLSSLSFKYVQNNGGEDFNQFFLKIRSF